MKTKLKTIKQFASQPQKNIIASQEKDQNSQLEP